MIKDLKTKTFLDWKKILVFFPIVFKKYYNACWVLIDRIAHLFKGEAHQFLQSGQFLTVWWHLIHESSFAPPHPSTSSDYQKMDNGNINNMECCGTVILFRELLSWVKCVMHRVYWCKWWFYASICTETKWILLTFSLGSSSHLKVLSLGRLKKYTFIIIPIDQFSKMVNSPFYYLLFPFFCVCFYLLAKRPRHDEWLWTQQQWHEIFFF